MLIAILLLVLVEIVFDFTLWLKIDGLADDIRRRFDDLDVSSLSPAEHRAIQGNDFGISFGPKKTR